MSSTLTPSIFGATSSGGGGGGAVDSVNGQTGIVVLTASDVGAISALTGDVTASGSGSVAATLASTAVTPGSYTRANITVDAKGRITAASSGSTSGLPYVGLTGDEDVSGIKKMLDQFVVGPNTNGRSSKLFV